MDRDSPHLGNARAPGDPMTLRFGEGPARKAVGSPIPKWIVPGPRRPGFRPGLSVGDRPRHRGFEPARPLLVVKVRRGGVGSAALGPNPASTTGFTDQTLQQGQTNQTLQFVCLQAREWRLNV